MSTGTGDTQYLTAYVNTHYLGIPIAAIQDVTGPQSVTRIPLSSAAIAGVLNLRGRIVTVIDMHERLGEVRSSLGDGMGIIVESNDELFSLRIDRVEDVITLPAQGIEKAPPTLSPFWQTLCTGVYQRNDSIMIILDLERILALDEAIAA